MTDKIIKLGGQDFVIPELAIRQMKVIFPLIKEVNDALQSANGSLFNLKEKDFDSMLAVVLVAIQAAKPSMTKDDLLNLRIMPAELIDALPVIASQSGMIPASGEA